MNAPLYNTIGRQYDSTRRADSTIVGRLLALLGSRPGVPILDVACGSGNYTAALAFRGLTLTGVDQSSAMLDQARRKPGKIEWVQGDAERLPFSDARFGGALCTFAVYLFRDPAPVFAEIFRVLSGGRLVIFTFAPQQVRGYWLNEYFPITMERVASRMPTEAALSAALHAAGFTSVRREPFRVPVRVEDNFLYSGKHRPHVYLSDSFRAGISAFVTLGEPTEIAEGIRRLADDIRSGRIRQVMEKYPGREGDCLFLVAEKKDFTPQVEGLIQNAW